MAQYQWTGAGETVGNAPTLLNSIWRGTIDEWEVQSDTSADVENKVLTFVSSGSKQRQLDITAAGKNISGRLDARGRFYKDGGTAIHFVRWNTAGASGSETSLHGATKRSSAWVIDCYVDGGYGNITEGVSSGSTPQWYRFHLLREADGDTTLKIWEDAAAESTAVEVTVSKENTRNDPAAVGGIGFGNFSSGGKMDWISFGTDGDDAVDYEGGGGGGTPDPVPVLSNVNASTDSIGNFSGSITTDKGEGTLYYVVSTAVSAPTAAEVALGEDGTGSTPAASGSKAVSSAGSQGIQGGGLVSDVTYYLYATQSTAAGNANVVQSGAFDYTEPTVPVPVPTQLTTTQITGVSALLSWVRG